MRTTISLNMKATLIITVIISRLVFNCVNHMNIGYGDTTTWQFHTYFLCSKKKGRVYIIPEKRKVCCVSVCVLYHLPQSVRVTSWALGRLCDWSSGSEADLENMVWRITWSLLRIDYVITTTPQTFCICHQVSSTQVHLWVRRKPLFICFNRGIEHGSTWTNWLLIFKQSIHNILTGSKHECHKSR